MPFEVALEKPWSPTEAEKVSSVQADGKRCLRGGPDAPQAEFPKQGTLVQESGAQDIGDFQNGAYHALGERVWA